MFLENHIAERNTKCRKSYEKHIAADKRKFVATLGEMRIFKLL